MSQEPLDIAPEPVANNPGDKKSPGNDMEMVPTMDKGDVIEVTGGLQSATFITCH